MHSIRSRTGALVLGVFLLFAGCTDTPTAPTAHPEPTPVPSYGLLGGLLGGLDLVGEEVTVLERSEPLAEDEVVTEVIGRSGGVLRLPEAGLTVFVPRYALRRATEITVTAPAGDLVGYHFEPHGLEFRRPLTVVQDMTLADVLFGADLSAVYFEGELEPEVTALESLPLWLLRVLGVFRIEHFSGYVIATN